MKRCTALVDLGRRVLVLEVVGDGQRIQRHVVAGVVKAAFTRESENSDAAGQSGCIDSDVFIQKNLTTGQQDDLSREGVCEGDGGRAGGAGRGLQYA